MKEITSIRLGKKQIITEDVWNSIVERGWKKLFRVVQVPERKLSNIPIIIQSPEIKVVKAEIPKEVKTKTIKKNG
jgi:hypothetical protein